MRRSETRRHVSPSSREDSASLQAIEQLTHHCVRAVAPGGNAVVLHVPSGVYLRLDGSATVIVDLLVETGDIDRAVDELATQFEIPREQAATDIVSVVSAINGLRASRGSNAHQLTASGAASTVRSWWGLPSSLRVAVCRATVAVVVVEFGLRFTDVARLARWMRVPLAATAQQSGRAVDGSAKRGDEGDAGSIAQLSAGEARNYLATMWVLDRWLYDGTCLRRALVSGFFLRRRHPHLHLGLIGDGETSHAWVEAEGMKFNAVPVTGTFSGDWGRPEPTG